MNGDRITHGPTLLCSPFLSSGERSLSPPVLLIRESRGISGPLTVLPVSCLGTPWSSEVVPHRKLVTGIPDQSRMTLSFLPRPQTRSCLGTTPGRCSQVKGTWFPPVHPLWFVHSVRRPGKRQWSLVSLFEQGEGPGFQMCPPRLRGYHPSTDQGDPTKVTRGRRCT